MSTTIARSNRIQSVNRTHQWQQSSMWGLRKLPRMQHFSQCEDYKSSHHATFQSTWRLQNIPQCNISVNIKDYKTSQNATVQSIWRLQNIPECNGTVNVWTTKKWSHSALLQSTWRLQRVLKSLPLWVSLLYIGLFSGLSDSSDEEPVAEWVATGNYTTSHNATVQVKVLLGVYDPTGCC